MSGTDKPKVVFLNHWAKELGGAEHSLLDMLYYIRDSFDAHLVATESGTLIEKASSLGVTCHIVPCGSSVRHLRRWSLVKGLLLFWPAIIAFLIYSIRLKKLIKALQPELIHGNVPKAHMALFFLVKTGFKGKSCFHIREIFNSGSLSFTLYKQLFPKKNCLIIAISRSVKNNLPHSLQEYTKIVYNGISIPTFRIEYRNTERIKLLFLGRIVPWKGCHLLIDILSIVRNRCPSKHVELSLVGDSMYWSPDYKKQLLKRIKHLNLSPWCHLYPFTKDPMSVFKSHDIFCNTSFQEPFGRVIAEAQACGMPVVAFDTGAVSEIVESNTNGILVPYNDLERFSNAVERLIMDHVLRKSMGLQGRKIIEHKFDIKNQGPALRDMLSRHVSL